MITVKRVPPAPVLEEDIEIRLSATEARALAKICWVYEALGKQLDMALSPRDRWIKYYYPTMSKTAAELLRKLHNVNVHLAEAPYNKADCACGGGGFGHECRLG